ncbi:glycosyl hydrolase [Paenibacillus sp. KS-LC4]|uniref:glycoside hydrolase family 26 protein n=1 Tax=Paenibacillus sp. KS-LC4 TaxID=2979727 RepID=UPI0030D388FB
MKSTKFALTLLMLASTLLWALPVSAQTNFYNGAWIGTWPNQSLDNIAAYEQLIGGHQDVVHTFVNSNQGINEWKGFMDYVNSNGSINLLTLEFKNKNYKEYSTADINRGVVDAYLKQTAKQLMNWQAANKNPEIWLRLFHEGNGNWYGWGVGDSTVNTNETYKAAFQRVVTIFKEQGATNIKFMYNVNAENVGKNASFTAMYPGDAYVDMLSIDGYNFGTKQSWSSWRTFDEVFHASYQALTSISSKPIIIAETGTTESGGSKKEWVIDAMNQVQSPAYSQIKGLIWFNENKELDWHIDSSADSLSAYQTLQQTL